MQKLIFILFLSLIIGISCISNYSLWIDEAVRIQVADLGLDEGYWHHRCNHLQIGLCHMQYLWSMLFGKTEFAYRSLNLPFLLIACSYMTLLLKKHSLSPFWALLFCAHPITTYYMNDASPYIILLASSCGAYYHAFFASNIEEKKNSCILLTWLLFGFFVHFIFGFACIIYIFLLIKKWFSDQSRKSFYKHLLIGTLFSPFFLYFAYTYLQHMSNGTERGWGPPGFFNIGVAGYAFLGLSGLGLARNDMRFGDYHLITPYMIACISITLSALTVLLFILRNKILSILKAPIMVCAAILGVVFFTASYSQNFQFWERHLIFLFPPFFIFLAYILQHAWVHCHKRLGQSIVVLLGGGLLLSSIQLRWKENYRKDDFKGALQYIKTSEHFNSAAPILAQGCSYIYHYYNFTNNVKTTANTNRVYLLGDTNCETIINKIEQLAYIHPKIILILTQKDSPKSFYKSAENAFQLKDFEVTSNTDYNTIKILFLTRSKKHPVLSQT